MTMVDVCYYTKEGEVWRDYRIQMHAPEAGPHGQDALCRVVVNGEPRDVFGIDNLQALVLATMLVQNALRQLVEAGTALYLARDVDQQIEIPASLLGDYSRYLP